MMTPYSYLVLPLHVLDATTAVGEWVNTLSKVGLSERDIFELCLDFYLDFLIETPIGVMSEDPILFRYLVIHHYNFDFNDKLTERLLHYQATYQKSHILQTIADLGYVMLMDIERRLNQHITASKYPVFGLDTTVLECNQKSVTIGVRYDSTRVRPRKFYVNDPTLLPH